MRKQHTLALADSICAVRSREDKKVFFSHVNAPLDWSSIKLESKASKRDSKGITSKESTDSVLPFETVLNHAFSHGVVLFIEMGKDKMKQGFLI